MKSLHMAKLIYRMPSDPWLSSNPIPPIHHPFTQIHQKFFITSSWHFCVSSFAAPFLSDSSPDFLSPDYFLSPIIPTCCQETTIPICTDSGTPWFMSYLSPLPCPSYSDFLAYLNHKCSPSAGDTSGHDYCFCLTP